jgi:hypothetical protein
MEINVIAYTNTKAYQLKPIIIPIAANNIARKLLDLIPNRESVARIGYNTSISKVQHNNIINNDTQTDVNVHHLLQDLIFWRPGIFSK